MSKETLENNLRAATMPKSALRAAGLLDSETATREISTRMSKKLYGFSRKQLPPDLPTEPRLWIFSVSEYGETVSLGAGFGEAWKIEPCPEGAQHGPACAIKPIYFQEEVVVDKTEHTPYTDVQIAECSMKAISEHAPVSRKTCATSTKSIAGRRNSSARMLIGISQLRR